MNFGLPVTTTQTVPLYTTQSIPVYGNSIATPINNGLTTPLLTIPNFGTTTIPISTNNAQIPVSTPLNQSGLIYPVTQPQMTISPVTTPQILNSNVPGPLIIIPKESNQHIVSNYPIDEKDPRRLPRYNMFNAPMTNYNHTDLRKASLPLYPIYAINPMLNLNTGLQGVNTNLPGLNNGIPSLNNNLPVINTGLQPGLNNTGNI